MSTPLVIIAAKRMYHPKVSLDRGLDETVADRKSIYLRKRLLRGKRLFPNQVLEPAKPPTPILDRIDAEMDRDEEARGGHLARLHPEPPTNATSSLSLESASVESWCARMIEVHYRPRLDGSGKPLPTPPTAAPTRRVMRAAVRCVLTPVGSQIAEGYGQWDVLWSWVLVLTFQEEAIRRIGDNLRPTRHNSHLGADDDVQDRDAEAAGKLASALEAAVSSNVSPLFNGIVSTGVVPIELSVPLSYILSFASSSSASNPTVGTPSFANRKTLYEHVKANVLEAAKPGMDLLPVHPLSVAAVASCFAGSSNSAEQKSVIAAHTLSQLRRLVAIKDPARRIALLLGCRLTPSLVSNINSSLKSLGVAPYRALPLLAPLCNTFRPDEGGEELVSFAGEMLECEDTRAAGMVLLRNILGTRMRVPRANLIRLLAALEQVPRSAESDALVLQSLRRFDIDDGSFSADDCRTLFNAAWRVGEIPMRLLKSVQRDWATDPASTAPLARLKCIAV